MPQPSTANPSSKSNPHLTYGAPLAQPASSFKHRSASMFTNATNNKINNSVFITNNHNTTNMSSSTSPLDLLYKSAAPNAILNSGGRADDVRCHPGTRKEVIGLVEKSIAQRYTRPRMLWLSGPAGAGKSAIMQTVAERCKDGGAAQANFFFFRADSSRNDVSPFVATIMHQIIQQYPSVIPAVAATLRSNPLVFQMGIQHQFDVLLHQALATLHHTLPSLPPLALLIDGLDECDSENKTGQRQLLQALDTLLAQKGQYFRVVVASRVEPQISMTFGQLHSKVDSIFLDEKYSPEKDIHRFVTTEFNKIKSSHYLASTLGRDWPSQSDIVGIVSKSSGQFIFAATVMRFIAYSSASPILSLQKVRGIVPPAKSTPFAQVDAIYAYIMGQVDDLEAVKALLTIKILNSGNYRIPDIMMAYKPRFSRAVFDSCLSELAPLISTASGKLEFFHASFPDFLHDETRSGAHHIDLETFCIEALPSWWRNQSFLLLHVISLAVNKLRQPTPNITAALMEFSPTVEDSMDSRVVHDIIHGLHRIYAPHDLRAFIKIMSVWISTNSELAAIFPENLRQSITYKDNSRMYLSTHQMQSSTRSSSSPWHPFSSQACPPAHKTWPIDLRTSPLTHQKYSSISQMPPSTSYPRHSSPQTPKPPKTRPSDRQKLPSARNTRQPSPETRRQSTTQTRPSTSKTLYSTHQVPLSSPETRPLSPEAHTFGPKTRPFTSQTLPLTPKTHTFTSQTGPSAPQTPHSIPQRPSISQTRSYTPKEQPTIAQMSHDASEKGILVTKTNRANDLAPSTRKPAKKLTGLLRFFG